MKNTCTTMLLLLSFLTACTREPTIPSSDCVDQYLTQHQLVAYQGQELGCSFFVRHYELDGKDYFLTDCNCADMLYMPIDCDGTPYSSDYNGAEYEYFRANAVDKGVLAIVP